MNPCPAFEFTTAARVVFGPGTLAEAGPAARRLGRFALVVTGRSPERAAPLRQLLARHDVGTAIFPVAGEPSIEAVQAGAEACRAQGCDVVVGFGGGSALDAAKAIAAIAAHAGRVEDYLEVIGRGQALTETPRPCVAIPTTAGTGAEVTRNAVLTSPAHALKASLRSPLLLPRLAIVDPNLTAGLPRAVAAATGLDALTQLIEAFLSCRANPLSDGLCREGLVRAVRSIRTSCSADAGLEARSDMALASLFSGFALANAGLGAAHGFAAPLGGRYGLPHGAICAALLAPVFAVNLEALRARAPQSPALERCREIAALLTGQADARPEDALPWLRDLVRDLGIPSLREGGLEPAHFPDLVTKAAAASSMKGNPIPLTPEELTRILAST